MSDRGLNILDLHRLHLDFAERPRGTRDRRKRRLPRSGPESTGARRRVPRQGDLLEQEPRELRDQYRHSNSGHLRESPDTQNDHSWEEGAR